VITAVDTNVLLDLFGADPAFGTLSKTALRACIAEGRLVACEVVWAETAVFFPSPAVASDAMDRIGVDFSPIDLDAALGDEAWESGAPAVRAVRAAAIVTPRGGTGRRPAGARPSRASNPGYLVPESGTRYRGLDHESGEEWADAYSLGELKSLHS